MICIRLTIFYQSFFCFFPKQVKITPKTTGPGLIPEARRETLSERLPKLSSDNRHWINTRSTTGKLSALCQLFTSEQSRRVLVLNLSYYQQQLQSLAYDTIALDGILSPSVDISPLSECCIFG